MIDPLITTLIGICFALLFGMAGLHKLRNQQETQQAIDDYEVLPRNLVTPARWVIPLVEIAIAIGLLVPAASKIAAISGAGVLTLYALAMAVNLYRGRRDLECGCSFGTAQQSVSELLVARNILLAALISVAALPASDRLFGALDGFTLGVSMLAASILYATANTLIENQTKRI